MGADSDCMNVVKMLNQRFKQCRIQSAGMFFIGFKILDNFPVCQNLFFQSLSISRYAYQLELFFRSDGVGTQNPAKNFIFKKIIG